MIGYCGPQGRISATARRLRAALGVGQAARCAAGGRVTFSAQGEAPQELGSSLVAWGQLSGLWGGTRLPSASIVKSGNAVYQPVGAGAADARGIAGRSGAYIGMVGA